jgi:DHA2 family multidrug resistance protein
MNLARNIGGSVGISIVTTMLDRRQQFHLNRMSSHLSASSPSVQAMLQGTARALETKGLGASEAMHKAYALLQATVFRQASMLAYIDNFWLLGVAILVMVPLVFLMKRPPTGGAIAVH